MKKPFKNSIFLSAWLSVFLTMPLLADSLTIELERQDIEQGDVISLYIHADFQTLGNTLDYEALKQDFEVISRQRSNFYEVVNGKQQANTRWHLRLLPKTTGRITVPPIKLGTVQSQPYTLEVKPSKPLAPGETPSYFIQAQTNLDQVYLQQETLYTLRFYHQGKLISGNIRPPGFGNALVDNLKDENLYDKIIDGKYFTVYEWVYVLYPQTSGQMVIQAPEFNGLLLLEGKQKAVKETAQEINIEVLPIPSQFLAPTKWLPAKSVFLKQEWKNLPQKIRVGDSLTRVITLQVFGQKANQLPIIETPAGNGYKIYKQQPLTQEEKLGDGIISQIEIIQTIVPTESGKLELPEQEISWWNTNDQRLETLYLEARHFDIQPGMAPPDYERAQELSAATTAQSDASPTHNQSMNPWLWVSLAFALLWLLTLAWAVYLKRQGSSKPTPAASTKVISPKSPINWCQSPAGEFYQQLRNHVKTELNVTLADLTLDDQNRQRLDQLEQHLFFEGRWTEQEQRKLCAAIGRLKPETASAANTQHTQLASLYKES